MLKNIVKYLKKPILYQNSSDKFWDDPHISKYMLEAHLSPDEDAATRNHDFVKQSAAWIGKTWPSSDYPKLLDLGCGPGIYAELFAKNHYHVTGWDFSERSICYARENAHKKDLEIDFFYRNYLNMDYHEEFDIITLIWCDFGALKPDDRKTLLSNIYKALKPGGYFIFDVFTRQKFQLIKESKDYEYYPLGGFWNNGPHICLNSNYLYDEELVMLRQTIAVTNDTAHCYNIWEHYFTLEELKEDLLNANLETIEIFDNIAGKKYSGTCETLCMAARKSFT